MESWHSYVLMRVRVQVAKPLKTQKYRRRSEENFADFRDILT